MTGLDRSSILPAIVLVLGIGICTTTVVAAQSLGPDSDFFDLDTMPFKDLPNLAWAAPALAVGFVAFVYQHLQVRVLQWIVRCDNDRRFAMAASVAVWLRRKRQRWLMREKGSERRAVRAGRRLNRYFADREGVRSSALACQLSHAERGPWFVSEPDRPAPAPLLVSLLDDDEREGLDGARQMLAMLVGLGFSFILVTLGGSGTTFYLLREAVPVGAVRLSAGVAVVGLVGSWLSYHGSLDAAVLYGNALDRIIFLHRAKLYEHAGIPASTDILHEARVLSEISLAVRSRSPRRVLDLTDRPERQSEFASTGEPLL